MNPEKIVSLVELLINTPSVSGSEQEILHIVRDLLTQEGWNIETISVDETRYNIFASLGEPEILFTTHLDVVPAKPEQYAARYDGEKLYGRGACDAKGIAACMIGAAASIREAGAKNIALLFVVDEETSGEGARRAAQSLEKRGIRYTVNGEPSEGKLIAAHKGGVGYRIECEGVSCHSGYPELGDDAIAKLLSIIQDIENSPLGDDPVLGKATYTVGTIQGGRAANIVPDYACCEVQFRTVQPNKKVIALVENIAQQKAKLTLTYNVEPQKMKTLPGFESDVAAYCTDIPNLRPLGGEFLLYGPGSIHRAHTDDEHITIPEIADAFLGYQRLYDELNRLL